MDNKSPLTGNTGKPSKPVIRGKGKGKALNVIAAASGRDPAAIVKSVTEAETAAAARTQAEEAAKKAVKRAAEAQAHAEATKAKEEVTAAQIYDSLSPQEQYRFECFRRCGFASKSMEKSVAKLLINESEKRYLVRRGAMVGLGCQLNGGAGSVYDNAHQSTNTTTAAVTDASDVDSSSKKPNASRKRKKQSKKHILREESKRRRAAMDQPPPYFLGGSGVGSNGTVGNGSTGGSSAGQTPPLENLVVPSSASEIVAVVSTLAKCYAQRLVAAAKRMADAEEEEKTMDGTAANASSTTTQKPLLPHHFLEAHRHRARAGIDPGFWMADRTEDGRKGSFKKGGVGTAEAAALGTVDRDKACYLAALAAQDAYDKEVEKEVEDNRQGKDDSMEVEES